MKFKISIIFIVFYISSSRAAHARRKTPRMQLSAKTINDEIGYIKPISLGPNGKLNITRILSLLKEHAKKENHMLTSHNTKDKSSEQKLKVIEKRIEDSESKESKEDWFQETPEQKMAMAIADNKGTDSSSESDRSDDSDEGPMMRNGETRAEADLQYDFDEEDLRIALKK